MNRIILIFLVVCLMGCIEADIGPTIEIQCNKESTVSHPKNEALLALMDKYVNKGLPGISVLIEDGDGVWTGSAGLADLDRQIPFTTCHVSKAASITKMMVGTLTFILQQEGVLSIDDPISKYIDSKVLDKIENADGKTIRQLMNHSTGIFDVITSIDFYLAVINNPNKVWSQLELLKYVYGQPGVPLGAPYNASYSNTNTLLLSMCIEEATGRPHSALLREKVLEPLNMQNTFYQGRERIPAEAAQGYYDLHNNGTIVNMSNFITGSGNGYGGIFSNIYDLNLFLTAIFNTDSTGLLNSSSRNTMTEFIQEDADFFTGVGLIKKFSNKSDYAIGHTGRDLGYNADALYFPNKKRKMIFFVNYGTDGDSGLKPTFVAFENDLADLVLE